MRRLALSLACFVAATGPLHAADPARQPPGPPVVFAPTNPVGVASEVPRSPLTDAIAGALPRFGTAAEAGRHCPTDVVVWVGLGSNVYRVDGAKPVDPQAIGAFMCQADASTEGDRPLLPDVVPQR